MAATSHSSDHRSAPHRLGLHGIVLAWGIQAIVTQSLLVREAMVLMYGSEFAWGMVLFAWLFGVAAGGLLGGWLESKVKRPDLVLVGILLTLGVTACLEIWIFREARGWLDVEPGEFLSLGTTAWVAVVFVAPASSLVGMAFPLACRIREQFTAHAMQGVGPLGDVYAWESAGSLVGGAVFSFWAIVYLAPIEIALLAAAGTTGAAAGLLKVTARHRSSAAVLAVLSLTIIAVMMTAGDELNRLLVERRWRNVAPAYELVAEAETKYQNLAVGRLAEQYTLFSDGQASVDFPDPYTYVPLAHFWMCQHPAPHHVLVLGGGAEGLLTEILRHPVETVTYIEPDPQVVEIIEPFVNDADRLALHDERVCLRHQDARYFIKTSVDRFDLVMARLPKPTSALRARYFTREFFGELRRAMTEQSVLCLAAAAAPGELSEISGEYLASVRETLLTHFPNVTVGWGDPAHVFAASGPGLVSTDPAVWRERYDERDIRSKSFDPVWFDGATDWLDADKVERRAAELDAVEASVSTDLHPVVYLQRLLLWDRMTGGRSGRVIERIRSIGWHVLVLGMAVVSGFILLVFRARANWAGGIVMVSVATTGFATMALSIIWLFAFQNLYGYVYQRIGWIIAIFMGGLVVGCAVVTSCSKGVTSGLTSYLWRRLVVVDLLLAVMALVIPALLPVLSEMQVGPTSLLLVEVSVWTMVAATGALGGAAFALAGGLELGRTSRAGRAAAGIVGADHVGACLGALLTGILMVPVYGTATAAFILGGMKLASAVLLGLGVKKMGTVPIFGK